MKAIVKAYDAILDELDSWGLRLPTARRGRTPTVRVYTSSPDSDQQRLIGFLTQEGGDFVFRYAKEFASAKGAHPISAFPDLDEPYRSRQLWPFFAVRLPPTERADVQEALRRVGVRDDADALTLLGTLGKQSVASPYVLELVPA